MSNETFLIPIRQNNDLSEIALNELRLDLDEYPLHQRYYTETAYLPGNSRKYSLNQVKTEKSLLTKQRILFLGSSLTFGFGALGESFVDYLWKQYAVMPIKDTENGSTLVEQKARKSMNSYVARFKEEANKTDHLDVLVLELSIQDALTDQKLGEINKQNNFNTETIIGAVEYMISEAKQKWHCPILLYTGPFFANNLYQQMVLAARQIAQKWNIDYLDLYNNPNFNGLAPLYMADEIHPTRAGYLLKWVPVFEKKLKEMIVNQ